MNHLSTDDVFSNSSVLKTSQNCFIIWLDKKVVVLFKQNRAINYAEFVRSGDLEYFEVRIGNNSDDLGLRAGFATNHLCLLSSNRALGIKEGLVTFYCDNPIYGRFFSVQLIDPCNPSSLLICDIQFIWYIQTIQKLMDKLFRLLLPSPKKI